MNTTKREREKYLWCWKPEEGFPALTHTVPSVHRAHAPGAPQTCSLLVLQALVCTFPLQTLLDAIGLLTVYNTPSLRAPGLLFNLSTIVLVFRVTGTQSVLSRYS